MTDNLQRYPLSFGQDRLWFLEKLNPGSHNVNLAYRINGALDESSLVNALELIVARHAIYRTVFCEEQGKIFQVVHETSALPYQRTDLSHLSVAEQATEVSHYLNLEVRRNFILDASSPFHIQLLVLNPAEHILLMTKHHIITDGWSIGLFNEELSRNYAALQMGARSELKALNASYVEYVSAQRQTIDNQESKLHLSYWLKNLGGKTARLRLASQTEPAKLTAKQGGAVEVTLSQDVKEQLMGLRRELKATWFVLLLAALSALLNRLTSETDILIGAPVAGRNHDSTHEILGLFLNTLVFRIQHQNGMSFKQLVALAKRTVYDAYEHQEVPFERLVDELSVERDLDRNPLFDVFLNVTSQQWTELALSGATTHFMEPGQVVAHFPIALYATDQGETFRLRLLYQQGILTEDEAGEFLAQLVRFLGQAADNATAPVMGYSLLTEQALAFVPDPSEPILAKQYALLTELIAARCNEYPGHIALTQGKDQVTYQSLLSQARLLAQALIECGLQPGEVVSITGVRSPGLIVCALGVLLSRGVMLLVDAKLPEARQRLMTEHAQAKWSICVQTTADDTLGCEPAASTFIAAAETGKITFQPEALQPSRASELPQLLPDDAAYIFFTSGTTGVPRGVLGSHGSLSHFLSWQQETFQISPDDRVSQLTNTSFDVILREIFLPLVSGARLCLPALQHGTATDTGQVLEWLASEQITVLHTVPTLLEHWMEQDKTQLELTVVRLIFSAGEVLHGALVERIRERFTRADIVNLYGPTEATLAKSYFKLPETVAMRVQPLGTSLPETQLLVLKQDRGRCGINEVGEIFIRSPHLTKGYLGSTPSPRKPFILNPFASDSDDLLCPTGDAGHYRIDGLLAIDGRLDDQLKIRGVRISPGEVSAVVKSCEQVQACAVIPNLQKTGLVACVVTENNQPLAVAELRDQLNKRLPPAMVPGNIVQLDELPVTSNGKVDRTALSQVAYVEPEEHSYQPPRTAMERMLVDLWQQTLKKDRIGIDDHFFAIGGHSLLTIVLCTKIEAQINRPVALELIFQSPTIRLLAQRFEVQSDLKDEKGGLIIIPIKKEGSRPPLFWLSGGAAVPIIQQQLRVDRPFYFLNHLNLNGKKATLHTIPEIAQLYVEAIMGVDSVGPYYLGGYSFGGVIIHEIAHQLIRQGKKVSLLFLLDPTNLSLMHASHQKQSLKLLNEYQIFRNIGYITYLSRMINFVKQQLESCIEETTIKIYLSFDKTLSEQLVWPYQASVYRKAMMAYNPEKDCHDIDDIVVIESKKNDLGYLQEMFKNKVSYHSYDKDHLDLIEEKHALDWMKILNKALL